MIKFKLKEGVKLPQYETTLAAGFDVVADSIIKIYNGQEEILDEQLKFFQNSFEKNRFVSFMPNFRILFGTGLIVADMSENIEIQVRSRSSVSLKRGLLVANAPATIDADYRGEIGVIMFNSTNETSTVQKGERIAQCVPSMSLRIIPEESENITETERGSSGFGSTGTN